MFDYRALKGAMVAKGYTQRTLAEAIGMTESTLSLKLNNKSEFVQSEVMAIKAVLDLPTCDPYFFVQKIHENA